MNQSAKTVKKTFSQETSVSVSINADANTIWNLLTNASDFPRWNSTVTYIKGEISLGQKIELKAKIDEKRTFKLKIKEFTPQKHMRWGDAMGNRDFYLTSNQQGGTDFKMVEKIGGPIFPLFSKMLPSFDEAFDQYAADLKAEAESA
ncbi:MAG: SRPBCC domain-containing protein [Flavobacteriales bacterium]